MSVGVFNPYLSTMGGGERSTLAFARVIKDTLGTSVTVYSLEPSPSIKRMEVAFGFSLEGISLCLESDEERLWQRLLSGHHDVFVNHAYRSPRFNPSPVGFYAMMFPGDEEIEALQSYDYVLCNSKFTALYTDQRNPKLGEKIRVLYPPPRLASLTTTKKRWNEVLHLGRFSQSGHNKRQRELLNVASELQDNTDFQFSFCGRINEETYFQDCLAECPANAKLLPDVSEHDLSELLASAGFYVHMTGYQQRGLAAPHLCEHFGLALVEAMEQGAIPLVYGRGGPREIVAHGVSGFHFDTLAELHDLLILCRQLPQGLLESMSDAARTRAQDYTLARFEHELAAIVVQMSSSDRGARWAARSEGESYVV